MALAFRYTVVRMLYIALYMGGVHKGIAFLRTLTYIDNLNTVFGLFKLAVAADF